ncbi:hypothetical protein [Brevundimonas aurantiaca]|uniref:hypothetical protein n=1 Tax=Brevundimonas aurantiaca TaxID=74316 RepID=UPI00301985E1
MAFALPAAASAISAAAPAAAATAAKATLMTTLKSVAFNALTNLAISTALSVFQPQVGQSGRTFEFVIDPDGPIPFAAGRVGVAGSVIHRDTFGPDLMYYGIPFVLSGAGPITAIESFKADDYPMSFDANGGATTEPYRQELFFRSVLGHQPAPIALTTPSGFKNGATLPGWTSAHKLSGKAAGVIFMAENSKGSAFPTGEIKPLVQMMGLKGWDPTLDSTYPGGSGPCRLHDSSTWVTLTCPILWGLKWALGLWEGPTLKGAPAHGSTTDYQVGGIGAKLSGIDVPAFVAASNVAKANGWTVSAYPNTDDDKHQVLQSFLQAGGAIYSQRAGKISCISRAAPRTSIVTISAADTAGPLEIDAAASRIDRINTLRPRFWSPAHRWQMTALDGEVTAESYREEDGAVRSRGIDYPYVSNAVQVAQLAALQIANTREGIAGVIPLKPHLQRIRPGDAFTITEPGFVLNGLKCLCLNTDYDPATGVVRVSFVSETDGKYPFALGQSPTPPEPQVLTPVDPRYVTPPLPGDWTITLRPPAPGGGGLPSFDLTGVVSNDTATAIIVEYGSTATGPWTQAYQGPPTVTNIPIEGLQPGATYFVAVQYQRNQNYSDRYVYGPYTAPLLDPSPNAPTIQAINADITAAFGDIFDVSALVSQARTDIDAQGTEIAAARGGQGTLAARLTQLNQFRIDGDAALGTSVTNLTARTQTAEGDILDLKLADANEATTRAQAINQVSAKLVAPANEYANADLANGTFGFTPIWGFGGALPTISLISTGDAVRFLKNGGAFDGSMTRYGIVALDGGGVSKSAGGAAARNMWPVTAGERIAFAIDARTRSGSARWYMDVRWCNKDGGGSTSLGGAETTHGNTTYTRIGVVNDVPGDGFVWVEMTAVLGWDGSLGVADMELRRPTFARLATTATTLPAYTAPAGGRQIQALNSSVTQNALAITDLENQQALASWSVIANASGGKPARIGLTSSSLGSFVALDAPFIFWGDNTVFDDATDTLQTTVGPNIRVLAFGAPFGASENLLEWWGPSSIAIGSMTTANGLNGRMTTTPYVFDTVTANQAPRVASVPIDGRIGYNQALNTAALTAALAVPAFGKFVLSVQLFSTSDNDGSVISATGTASLKRLNGASETTLVSGVNVSGQTVDPAAKNTSALNVTVANSFAGNVTFRLDVQGGGGPSTSHGTVQGTLTVTWYPI